MQFQLTLGACSVVSKMIRFSSFHKFTHKQGFLRSQIKRPIRSAMAGVVIYPRRAISTGEDNGSEDKFATNKSWNDEWKSIGLGARLPKPDAEMTNLLFVQTGFGVDQHGDRKKDGATRAAVRAVRNAIEFNSIPGMIEAVPGGRKEMLIHVKLGIPPQNEKEEKVKPMNVDLSEIAKVFPYGKLMPIEVVVGGLLFPTGRIVRELGDEDDVAICVAASISIGYDSGDRSKSSHKTYDTNDGH